MSLPAPLFDARRARHLREPLRRVFPEEALVPETQLHLELRTILYQLLKDYLGDQVTVSCDQFVYWVADDPTEVLAPDACVRREPSGGLLRSWKTWERGAPEVAVEIVSESDQAESVWAQKLVRYGRMGVAEVVRFDPSAPEGSRLRVWDRLEGDLVERLIVREMSGSPVLPLAWQVATADGLRVALRIADAATGNLVPTRAEARQVEAAARQVEAAARQVEAAARLRAEARVAKLEAELAKLVESK